MLNEDTTPPLLSKMIGPSPLLYNICWAGCRPMRWPWGSPWPPMSLSMVPGFGFGRPGNASWTGAGSGQG